MSKQKAVVIGAGVAGLALALRLGEGEGYRPLLLEREPEPGGLARCLRFKGVSSDLGPHRIHTEIPEVRQLIERIAAPSIYTVKRKSHIYLRGKFLPYPPSPVAMTIHLGPLSMARFGASYALDRLRPAGGEESYESIMRRAFGPALYDFLIAPYTTKTWKTEPSELHADTARVRVSAGSLAKMVLRLVRRESKGSETALREFRYVRGGAQTLVRHLLEQAEEHGAELRTESPVESFEFAPDGRIAAVRLASSEPGAPARVEGDAFLSTVPLPVLLGRLLADVPALDEAREAATGLVYLNMIFVLIIVRRPRISDDNWLYFPEPEFVFNRGYEAKAMDPEMSPEDRSVICLEITSRPGDSPWTDDDDELARRAIGQLAGTGLFHPDEVEEHLVYRLPYAYPVYGLDYDQRLRTVLQGLRAAPNLMTLGRQGLFNHNNMDHSIWMGLQAARQLEQSPDASAAARSWHDAADQFKHMRIVD